MEKEDLIDGITNVVSELISDGIIGIFKLLFRGVAFIGKEATKEKIFRDRLEKTLSGLTGEERKKFETFVTTVEKELKANGEKLKSMVKSHDAYDKFMLDERLGISPTYADGDKEYKSMLSELCHGVIDDTIKTFAERGDEKAKNAYVFSVVDAKLDDIQRALDELSERFGVTVSPEAFNAAAISAADKKRNGKQKYDGRIDTYEIAQEIQCGVCGAYNWGYDPNGTCVCLSCMSAFSVTEEKNAARKYSRSDLDELFDTVRGILIEKDREKLKKLHDKLTVEANKEYFDEAEILRICRDIQKLSPDDFSASFFTVMCGDNPRAAADFLFGIDVEKYSDYLEVVLSCAIKLLKRETLLAVSELIGRAYENTCPALYGKWNGKFQEEAVKIDECVYDPTLTRDVFIAYSSKDMAKVIKLVDYLENECGLTCYVAARNLQHGRVGDYEKTLHEAIDNCRAIVLVSSYISRTASDAWKLELKYVRDADYARAPSEYTARRDYGFDRKYKKPRVEYIIEAYKNKPIEKNVKEFFDGYERVSENEFYTMYVRLSELLDPIGSKPESFEPNPKPKPNPVEPDHKPKLMNDLYAEIKNLIERSSSIVLVDYSGITIGQNAALRKAFGDAGVTYKIIKTGMLSRAFTETNNYGFEEYLEGPTAVAFGNQDDPLAPCRILNEYENKTTLKIKAALINGEKYDANGIKALLNLPENNVFENDDISKFIVYGGTLVGYTGKNSIVKIPNNVVRIADQAFFGRGGLAVVEIPNGVTKIGKSAFAGCVNLTSITIPKSVTIIGAAAFSGCTALTIYCEASEKPYGWSDHWNPVHCRVVWGYEG